MLKIRMFNQVISILFVMICFMASSSAFSSGAILQITPSSTGPITISPTGNSFITYTVTNHTTGHVVNNFTFDPYYNLTGNPLSLTIANNNCVGQSLQVGQSCTFQLNIQGTGQPTNVMLSPRVCIYNSGTVCSQPIESNRVNVVVETNSPILVAAGTNNIDPLTNKISTLLAQSLDGGTNWAFQTVLGAPTGLTFTGVAASCTGSGTTAFCVAAAQDVTQTNVVLYQTRNGGQTWTYVPITPSLPGEYYQSSACTGGNTCIVVGGDLAATGLLPAIINQSTDGGVTWTNVTIPNNPVSGIFYTANCTGSGSTSICTAAGLNDPNNIGPPMLAQSIGGGEWSFRSIPDVTTHGFFNGASCTGAESTTTTVCVAAGINTNGGLPYLAQSVNGTTNWQLVTVAGLPAAGFYNAVSCTVSGTTAICAAVGRSQTQPLLVQTTNGGSNWSVQSISGLPASGFFNRVNCIGSGSTAICVAVGKNSTTGAPLLAQSTNGGTNWSVVTVPDMPAVGTLNGIACTVGGLSTICVAGGQNESIALNTGPAFLVQTNNGGTTWQVITVPNTPSNSVFASTGASGGSQLVDKPYGARKALEKVLHQ